MTTDAEIVERRARLLGPMAGQSDEQVKQYVHETFSQLASALDSLSGEQATWRPDEAEWSAAQVGDHVALATGVMGNVIGLLAKGQAVTDADWDPPPQFRGSAADLEDVTRRLRQLPGFTDGLFDQGAETDNPDVTANNSLLGHELARVVLLSRRARERPQRADREAAGDARISGRQRIGSE